MKDLGPPYTLEKLNHLLGTRFHTKATHYATFQEAEERALENVERYQAFMSYNVLDRAGNVVKSYRKPEGMRSR